MLEHTTISIDLNQDWRELYERIWQPEAFLRWASALCGANLKPDGAEWSGDGPEGPMRVRFTEYNHFGVLDHTIRQAGEPETYLPMRVFQNGGGATIALTLFRAPGMTDSMFATDAEWIKRDLAALKQWLLEC